MAAADTKAPLFKNHFWHFQIKIKFKIKIMWQGSIQLPDTNFLWIIPWIIFRSQHRHTSFLPEYWYHGNTPEKIKFIFVHTFASHFSHTWKNISQNQPYFDHNYLEKPTSAHKSFWFFWLSIIMQINHKIHVNKLASLNIEL